GPNPHAQIPALIERGNKRTLEFFANIDGHLASRQFMAGDRYSIADITTLVAVDFAKWIKLEAPAELVHLTRWYTEVSQRPSAQA
ncbi:MAG: glutathione S-transferase family protein, partial [Pseudomonadales bacterium]|nr:glutathione S-transferase family protein [Pseudomonadales bacterium]